MRPRMIGALVVTSIPLAVACSDALSPESLAGTYIATRFTLSGAIVGDVLAEGGSLTITLNADGTTTGLLSVPASLLDGEDFNASMGGTFTIGDQTLTFTQEADTFVRDLTWIVDGSELRASGTFSEVTVIVVLKRQ
jgi:hypothetical protein